MGTIQVEFLQALLPEDIEIFKRFCIDYKDYKAMKDAGVFSFKNGTAFINRDSAGILKDIEIKAKVFVRKKVN